MAKGPRQSFLNRMRMFSDPAFQRAVGEALYEGADAVAAEAKRSITAGSMSGKNHVASKPGEPPHNDSGHLKSNIEVTQDGPFTARVTSNASYSAVHEFGSSTHPARPFIRPARDKVKGKAEAILNQKINVIIRRYRGD